MPEIEEEVLERIKPDEKDEQRIRNAVDVVLKRLEGLDAQVHGSFKKGTWLKGDTDVDVFVFFDKNLTEEYLKNEALRMLMERLKGIEVKISYAQHPYLITYVNGVEIDVVPALKVESGDKAITPVDRTPFHTQYVTSHLDEKGKDQVRLLKRFMKGIGVYGAEIKVQGFSGYVTELLTIYYGGFREVLKGASSWKKPPIMLNLVEPLKEFQEPLIIPDPVDPKRNTAAAVSLRSIGLFSISSYYYLKESSMDFFFPKEPNKNVEAKGDVLLVKIRMKEEISEDILWGMVRRSMSRIRSKLKELGFRLIDIEAWGDNKEIFIGIELESKDIGRYYLNIGPPFYAKERIEDFISKNENVWVGDDGFLYSIKERKEYDAKKIAIENIVLKGEYDVDAEWVSNGGDDKYLNAFLYKRPGWLVSKK